MAATHIYHGRLTEVPREFVSEGGPAWWHVVCWTELAPCSVAATKEGLSMGDRLDPGSSIDLYGDRVWVVGPRDGQDSAVLIELREAPTFRSVDVQGQLSALNTWKGIPPYLLKEKAWTGPILTNVVGMVGAIVRVQGGAAYIGTHVELDKPPYSTTPGVTGEAGALLLKATDPPRYFPGNPTLYAWADAPGVTLYLTKLTRGRQFIHAKPYDVP